MKNQSLFSSKDKSEKLKCRLLQFLFGALRVIFQLHVKQVVTPHYNHLGVTDLMKSHNIFLAQLYQCTVKTLNIGTPRPVTVAVLNLKHFNFTMK